MAFELLEQYRKWIWNCQACSTCLKGPQNPYHPFGPTPNRICPEYQRYRNLSNSCMGRIQDIKWIMEGKLQVSDEFVKKVYDCLMCGACGPERMGQSGCVVDRQQVPMFRALRAELVKMGKGPIEPFKRIASAIEKEGNRFGAKVEKAKWIPEGMNIPAKADMVYFAGCVASYRANEIAQATAKILKHAGVEFAVLGEEEWCCGNPLADSGQQEAFENVVKHNIEAIKKAGAKKVVTSCGCCYNVLKLRYPEVQADLGFEVVHITEVLAGLLDQGKIKPKEAVKAKITYQDPCHIARLGAAWSAGTEEPRKLINSIPGVEFAEMEGNRGDTQCCGRYVAELPELSLFTGINRVKDARTIGAETIVTACSFCKWNLERAAKDMGDAAKVMDITQLVAQSLGL